MAHLPVVTSIARRMLAKLPASVDPDDIHSVGVGGLMDAAERFDCTRAVRFRTYAEVRIRGAMLDYLRSLSWVPRRLHGQARELERVRSAFEGTAGRSGTVSELAEAMGMTLEQYHLLVSEIDAIDLQHGSELWNDDGENPLNLLAADQASDPLMEIERKEMRELVGRAIGQLSDRHKILLKLYYDEELTMKEVGAALKITESRASQIHSKALVAMRREVLKLVGPRVKVH